MTSCSQCNDNTYTFQLSLNPLASSKASWIAYCVVLWNFFWEFSRISKSTYSYAGSRHLACNQAASSIACIIDRRWCTIPSMLISILINRGIATHLLSCCKLKCSTPKLITDRYIITLCSVFVKTIEVGYSPSLLLL